jgi:hypothetical protein
MAILPSDVPGRRTVPSKPALVGWARALAARARADAVNQPTSLKGYPRDIGN